MLLTYRAETAIPDANLSAHGRIDAAGREPDQEHQEAQGQAKRSAKSGPGRTGGAVSGRRASCSRPMTTGEA